MASYDAATAVNAYMGPFAPAAWRAAHASVAGRPRIHRPVASALPPHEMTQCPFCFIVIASFPSAPRPTTKAYATMLARIESHLLGHAAAATPSSSKFCAPCHLLIPAAQATAHARCPPHLLKLRHVVAPAMLAGGAASAHPLPPASPPRASAAQLPGPGHPPPDQESPPPPPPPFDDDAGAFSPPPSPGLTLGPPPALEPPVETPVSFVGPRCLTGRGATTGATDGVIGRVVVGAFGDSGVAARFCIYAWNAGTRMVGMFNMDRALCLADARKLDADKKDADDAAADRLLDMFARKSAPPKRPPPRSAPPPRAARTSARRLCPGRTRLHTGHWARAARRGGKCARSEPGPLHPLPAQGRPLEGRNL